MAGTRDKVIATRWRRQQLQADLFSLLEVEDASELKIRAAHIAQAGREIIPILLCNLDTDNSHLLAVLGEVCGYLSDDEIRPVLRRIAADAGCSQRERCAAGLILDRFVGENESEPVLYGAAGQWPTVPTFLWSDILDRSQNSRLVLVEYLQTIDEQSTRVVLNILEALQEWSGDQMIEPLCLLAQDRRPVVVKEALYGLGTIRHPRAAQVLQALIKGLSGESRSWAERSLRKLRLCGVDIEPLPRPNGEWRCLVSPPDGKGNQSIWFIEDSARQPLCTFLQLLLNDREGIVQAIGDDRALSHYFPPKKRPGSLHIFTLSEPAVDAVLLETDFDYGRRLVREALAVSGTCAPPLPPVYRLFADKLWAYDDAGTFDATFLPQMERESASDLLPYVGHLLEHPAFTVWREADGPVESSVPRRTPVYRRTVLGFRPENPGGVVLLALPGRSRARYAAQLRKMSEWLMLFGDRWAARVALAAAFTIEDTSVQELPFLGHLMEGARRKSGRDLQKRL